MCAGARVGGLGNMPGWWFTIESTTTKHFIQQLKIAVENALKSKSDVRAIMRARATKQRFPVSQWVEDLEKLQSSAIEISHKQAAKEKRPTFDSPSTPTILETPGLLSVLQSRFVKPPLRPRPAAVQGPNQSRGLDTISELRSHSGISQAPDQGKILNSFSEGHLLARSGPGLGSKRGPSGRRKAPPPPLLTKSSNTVARINTTAVRRQSDGEPADGNRRAPIPRSPSSPDLRTKHNLSERETTKTLERPKTRRSQSMPQLQPNDKKAVRLLGMQLSASRASALLSPKYSPFSSDENSARPPSIPSAPVRPRSAYYTSPLTPTTPLSSVSRAHGRTQSNSTAPSSVYGADSFSGDNSDSTATSISGTPFSNAAIPGAANSVKFNIIHTPHAVDSFPSLGPHFFPHGGISVLSTSDVQGGKPDNILQNVTPFFSDPDGEYETKFKQKLRKLNGKSSENQLCIEEYLLKSEKSWFGKLRAAELRKASEGHFPGKQSPEAVAQAIRKRETRKNEFGLGSNHKPPTGLKRVLRMKIGDWPVYSFLLAFVRDPTPRSR